MKLIKYTIPILAVIVVMGLSPITLSAQGISYTSADGWDFRVTGAIPVFLVASNHEEYSTNGDDQFATRIMSGFNPANITFNVSAPVYNGIMVMGTFQINHHLQGPSIQNAGLFEGRIADIAISGTFGTFNVGKGFGIFNSTAIGDQGSGMGVGRFLGPDHDSATLGRIGSGYTYANFNPRITYTSPDWDGLILKLGLINPEKPNGASSNVETNMPRIEAQADYIMGFDAGMVQLWAGGMYQNVKVINPDFDYNITGWDVGIRFNVSGFGLTSAFSQTTGVGADGLIGINLIGSGLAQAEVDAMQWYFEGTYTADKLTIGASYGEGSQDAVTTVLGSSPDITNQLLMVFGRYALTNNLTMLGEFQTFASNAQSNYIAFILGMQLNF